MLKSDEPGDEYEVSMLARRAKLMCAVFCCCGMLFVSLTLFAAETSSCIDHGEITFNGQELGAAQCGEKVIFSDATELKVPNGYILIRLGNDFYFYSPTMDRLLDVNVLERVAIGQEMP